jgi:glyoxylase-like metal-dependent hydrolase (beta-lactamase superfamily II)
VIEARRADGQTPPTTIWTGERYACALDGVAFELVYPGPTHGTGNVAAFFPELRLLFMVDTVAPGVGYTFFPDWHMTRYTATMRSLLALEWDTFVPGHFWAVDRRGFEESLAWIDVLREGAREALAAGVDADCYSEVHVWAKERLAQYAHLFRFHEYVGLNLMRLMSHELTGGWGLVDACR